MKLKTFQREDLARAALHNGLILAWDPGLGKTWAIFLWSLLKVGYTPNEILGVLGYLTPKPGRRAFSPNARRLRPKQPVLIIAPGDLHQQIADEAWEQFGIAVFPLDSQAAFDRLSSASHSVQAITDESGRPVVAPDFYITSYTQLTVNGVSRLPEVRDWPDATALRQFLCLKDGDHVSTLDVTSEAMDRKVRYVSWDDRPNFETTCHFFAWRGRKWSDEYQRLSLDAESATTKTLAAAFARENEAIDTMRDPDARADARAKLEAARNVLARFVTTQADPPFASLTREQRDFVTHYFCAERLEQYAANEGHVQAYEELSDGTWRQAVPKDGSPPDPSPVTHHSSLSPDSPLTTDPSSPVTPPEVERTWKIKCIYSPSLSDLCYNAFRAVAIDEGVKMKGADTFVGLGVRQMAPEYRLVLTATPIKNRAPDLFWLAHWATGGREQAHARFPYNNDNSEQTKFAETFMVCEQNLTKKGDKNKKSNPRYKKLTAEVCNVHRLWKLLGPIILRRRKDDCSEDIPPKIRKVIRCQMGTAQADVVQYHLKAEYLDVNEDEAIGARLQALRMAAADPTSLHLAHCPAGDPHKACPCTLKPVPPAEQLQRLSDRLSALGMNLSKDPRERREHQRQRDEIEAEIAKPVPRFDNKPAEENCQRCHGDGTLPLIPRSGNPYIPKHAAVLNLIHEILQRGEQVLVGSAFNDPNDLLSRWLDEAGVRHLKLDGRTSQKKRGREAAIFKRGRYRHPGSQDPACPVMLAGVECMAEGHSFHLANNVILYSYSWALDKFIQFINRVHRMTSPGPVNVYVVLCDGTIDRKLESLTAEKGDSAELVLDGRLIGERTDEVNLAELLRVAYREFDAASDTIDEGRLAEQWPALRENLRRAMLHWDQTAPVLDVAADHRPALITRHSSPATPRVPCHSPLVTPVHSLRFDPATRKYIEVTVTPVTELPPPKPTPAECQPKSPVTGVDHRPAWKDALRPKPARHSSLDADHRLTCPSSLSSNPWDLL